MQRIMTAFLLVCGLIGPLSAGTNNNPYCKVTDDTLPKKHYNVIFAGRFSKEIAQGVMEKVQTEVSPQYPKVFEEAQVDFSLQHIGTIGGQITSRFGPQTVVVCEISMCNVSYHGARKLIVDYTPIFGDQNQANLRGNALSHIARATTYMLQNTDEGHFSLSNDHLMTELE